MILRKSNTELNFKTSREPLASVEVDLDSIADELCGYGDIVADGLAAWAASNPDATATVYVFDSVSVNFHERTNSAFFGVVGRQAVLDAILAALKGVRGVRARHSDCILARNGIATFHVEGGLVWQAEDNITWVTSVADSAGPTSVKVARFKLDDVADGEDDDAWGEPGEIPDLEDGQDGPSDKVTMAPGLRFRRARADASIGSIKARIESVFGLPEGSVALCGPDGKVLRSDAKIRTLRKRWE